MEFKLPTLSYNYADLEPYFDRQTMEIHHTKHHQTYVNNTNAILQKLNKFSCLSEEDLITNLEQIPLENRNNLRNQIGGHVNHSIFWTILKKDTILQGNIKTAIENNFSTVENFMKIFEQVAITLFGSGWVWLVKKDKLLSIVSTANQDNPLMGQIITGVHGYPILGLDIWEHAYYLKYQNRRLDYIKSFWKIVNWNEVAARFDQN